MLIISSRPAIAAALGSCYSTSMRVIGPDDVADPGYDPVIVLDAVGLRRAFDFLAKVKAEAATARIALLVSSPSDLAAQLARRGGAQAILSESDSAGAWTDILARLPHAEFISAPSFRGAPAILSKLSERQAEVYLLASRGESDDAVATKLGISVATAETHRRDAQLRLDCASHRDLVAHAIRHGLVTVGELDLKPPMRVASRRHELVVR